MENPLVSIIVITYNSSKYVLETLESAKAQTYQNIELIISDDGSKDNTVELCEKWLVANKDRFVNSQIITVEKNTGIPANCNRGVKASKGEWIKLVAGDDILLEDCITSNLYFCLKNRFDICYSNIIYFNGITDLINYPHNDERFFKIFNSKNCSEKLLAYAQYPLFLNIPSLFYSKNLFEVNQGFDDTIILLEDQPFIIKTLRNCYDIGYLDVNTVKYRKEQISTVGNPYFFENLRTSFIKYRKPVLQNSFFNRLIVQLEQVRFSYLIKHKRNSIIFKITKKIYDYLIKKYF